jgi:hypothetical protein
MIHPTDPDDDLATEGGGDARAHLLDDLRRVHQPAPRLAAADAPIVHAIHDPSRRPSAEKAAPSWRPFPLRRLTAPIAALVLVALGTGTYLLGVGPSPVSAQTILRHAATAGLVSSQVTHFIYQITSSTGFTGTAQIWVQADTSGAPSRVAFDGTAPASLGTARALVVAYQANRNQSLPAPLASSKLTGQQTLDGVPVDVVQEPSGTVLYFDAHTYVLRGTDWSDTQAGNPTKTFWYIRLLHAGTEPASSMPAGSTHVHPTG